MLWFPKRCRIVGQDGLGRVLVMYVGTRFSIDLYAWPRVGLGLWSAWDVGVVLDVRLYWFELQIRRRL